MRGKSNNWQQQHTNKTQLKLSGLSTVLGLCFRFRLCLRLDIIESYSQPWLCLFDI